MNPESQTVRHFRNFALGLASLGVVVTPLELVFMEHYREPAQFIPFAALIAAAIVIAAAWWRPTARVLVAVRVVMLGLFLTALLGALIHLKSNSEFALQIDPKLNGLSLLWASLTGKAPVLATGILAQIGLLGLAFTYRHPALKTSGLRWTPVKILDR